MLVYASNDLCHPRIGVIAGHRVGGAVQRNRAKRRIRMILHALLPQLKPGYDFIFIARQPVATAQFNEVKTVIVGLIKRADLFVDKSEESAQPPA